MNWEVVLEALRAMYRKFIATSPLKRFRLPLGLRVLPVGNLGSLLVGTFTPVPRGRLLDNSKIPYQQIVSQGTRVTIY
jgi:hypothetical protein